MLFHIPKSAANNNLLRVDDFVMSSKHSGRHGRGRWVCQGKKRKNTRNHNRRFSYLLFLYPTWYIGLRSERVYMHNIFVKCKCHWCFDLFLKNQPLSLGCHFWKKEPFLRLVIFFVFGRTLIPEGESKTRFFKKQKKHIFFSKEQQMRPPVQP